MWFNVFGESTLYDEAGAPLDRFSSQRRVLALVAALVSAGEGGMSRDKLVGLLWPDFAPDRARHSLTQALYAARTASGRDDLFVGSETVRLNFDCIGADVREFESALQSGDLETAITWYRGPFLDGFYAQPSEFETWLHHERMRLEDLAVSAFRGVVDALEAEGNFLRAAEVARRLAAIRPADAGIAKLLMRLLAASGQRAAAVEHARIFSSIVSQRYDLEPDPDVLSLAEEIKAAPSPLEPPETQARIAQHDTAAQPEIETSQSETIPLARRRPPTFGDWLRTSWRWITPLLLVVLSLSIWFVSRRNKRARRPAPHHSLVVAPFRVSGADSRLHYLADGMIELLATRIADDTTLRSVNTAAAIRAWQDARASGSGSLPSDSVLKVARQLGAEQLISGSVIGTPDRVILDATIARVADGRIVAQATVEGSTDTLIALVDGLARKLLIRQIDERTDLAERSTVSLRALRSYINGSASFARRDYMIAFREYERAAAIDTSFSLAFVKLANTAARIGEFDRERLALDRAWRLRDNLAEADRAFLMALLGPRYPMMSPMAEAVAAWNRAARLAPERPEIWYGLAGARYRSTLAGLASADDEGIRASLQRSIALDSTFAQPRLLLAMLPGGPRVTLPRDARGAGPAAARRFVLMSLFTGMRLDAAARTLDQLESGAPNIQDALGLLTAEHSLRLMQDRPDAALEVTRRMQRLSPATRAHLRLRVLDAIYAEGDAVAASSAARQLHDAVSQGENSAADACVLAQWQLTHGDITGAEAIVRKITTAGYVPVLAGVHPLVCKTLLEAGIAVELKRPDAAARLQQLDSLDFMSAAAGDAAAYAHIALARWYLAVNLPKQALAAISRGPYSDLVWPRYRVSTSRLRAEISRQLSQSAAAPARRAVGHGQSVAASVGAAQ